MSATTRAAWTGQSRATSPGSATDVGPLIESHQTVTVDPRGALDRHEGAIAVIGAGGHGVVVAAAIIASGAQVAGFYDDDPSLWGRSIYGHLVVGPIRRLEAVDHRAIVAIGDNATRQHIVERYDLDWVTVVHPFTWVAPGVRLGRGAFVGAGAVVQPSSVVGDHVILNSRSGVGHDAIVEPFAHISVAYLGSGARMGTGALLAIGSSVLPGLHIGDWATVGAGAVVTNDVDAGTTVVGVPARPQPAPAPAVVAHVRI